MNVTKQMIIDRLKAGETIENYKEGGNSMVPLIYSRQPVTLSPVNVDLLEKEDIVFCKVNGKFYTHKVTAIQGDQVQIGNNKGHINGWTSKDNVFAIISAVEGKIRQSAVSKIKKG